MDYKTNSAPANSEAATGIRQTTGMGLTERKSGIKWKQTGDVNIQRWARSGLNQASVQPETGGYMNQTSEHEKN